MTDFEYDCLQKKRLARMAQYRKRGSKSKKCSLSTDHMTEKQWKERNGKVYTCNLNAPMSWEDFRALSGTTQKAYIQHLIASYNVNAASLGQMFGVNPASVRRFIGQNGLGISFRVGSSQNKEQRALWEKFLYGDQVTGDAHTSAEKGSASPEEPTEEPDLPAPEQEPMKMTQFSLVFEGKLDMSMIVNSIRGIVGGNAEGRIEIVCTL